MKYTLRIATCQLLFAKSRFQIKESKMSFKGLCKRKRTRASTFRSSSMFSMCSVDLLFSQYSMIKLSLYSKMLILGTSTSRESYVKDKYLGKRKMLRLIGFHQFRIWSICSLRGNFYNVPKNTVSCFPRLYL